MKKIETFNRAACKDVAALIEKRLQELATEIACSIEQAGGSFDLHHYNLKLKITAKSETATESANENARMELSAFDLADAFGKTFPGHSGESFRVIGANLRSHKMPIRAERVRDGRVYKFNPEFIRRAVAVSA